MAQSSVRQNYIQGEVFTATPQKLQLLLVEAAIKNIHRTKQFWSESNYDGAFESLTRAQDIVAEILCCFDVENSPDIAKKFASIYVFIFRCLTEAGLRHSSEKLDDALRVLDSERETWRLVCEKFGSTKTAEDMATTGPNVGAPKAISNTSASGDIWSAATPVQPVNKPVAPPKTTGTPANGPLAPPNSTTPIPGVPLNSDQAAQQVTGFSWDA